MFTIHTVIDELLDNHIDEEFEISELLHAPVLSITVKDGELTTEGDVSDLEKEWLLVRGKYEETMLSFKHNFSVIGYVVGRKFYLCALFQGDSKTQANYTARCAFIELFKANPFGAEMQHVPVAHHVVRFDRVKGFLDRGQDRKLIEKFTIKELVDLASGASPLRGVSRKGLVFKSLTTDFSFKVYPEDQLMSMGSL